jgi:4-hydroxy-tetrahydrodipicolinate synthase
VEQRIGAGILGGLRQLEGFARRVTTGAGDDGDAAACGFDGRRDDGTAFPLYACGSRGVISVVSNVAPREMSEMWDAVKAGQWDKAKALHYKLRVLNQMLFAEPSPAPTKAALSLINRCSVDVRLPLVNASEKLVGELKTELRAAGLL